MRFRRRLVVAVAGVTSITLGGAFAAVAWVVHRDEQRELDSALVERAHEQARLTAARGGTQLLTGARSGLYANDVEPLTAYEALFGADGQLLSATRTSTGDPLPPVDLQRPKDVCFDVWFHRQHLRAVLTSVPGSPGHVLLLAAPSFDLDSDTVFLRRAMLLIFAVAVAWATLVATWIVRRLTRAHAGVAAVAHRVAEGDLTARVVPDGSDAEMMALGSNVNGMIERLGKLLANQEEFITHAAHELRSPLTTLHGQLTHALRRSRDAEAYRRAIEAAVESSQRLRGLADSLLTLARIDGAAEEPWERVRLDEVLANAHRAVEAEAARYDVGVDVAAEPLTISGRAQDLERLFCNLLENAIRHSPSGTRVCVSAHQRADEVEVHVIDHGVGIAPEERERVFEPFYRGPSAQGSPGYGLGLAIARKIARRHRGELLLGQPERGTELIVRLPVQSVRNG